MATVTETEREVPPRVVPVTPGTRIGRYVVEAELGAGGMGVVYRARDPELDRSVAIKMLHRHLGGEPERLLREGRTIANLRHPNIVTIHDVGTHDGSLFIAMELVDGTTLRRWLERPRELAAILAAFAAAGAGLAAAHAAGVVHRDFKPDNVLVGTDGRVVVGDFGVARTIAEDGAGVEGTPGYMAPEQLRGEPAGAASDQFSFCVALYAAIYGARPVAGAAPPDRRGVPARIQAAIRRGLAVAPAARHPSMTALLAELASPRRRAAWWLAGALVVAGVLAWLLWPSARAADPCAAADRLDDVWNDAAHATARQSLARDRYALEDLAQFELFAARWRAARLASCAAPDEPRARCLDAALDGFAKAIATPIAPSAGILGITPWPQLPSLERCASADPARVPKVTALGVAMKLGAGRVLSPDGAQIATAEAGRLHVMTVGGKDVASYAVPEGAEPTWWGDKLVLSFDRTEPTWPGHDLLLDPATGATTEVPIGREVLADDGTHLLEARDGQLFAVTRANGARIALGPTCGAGVQVLQASWSPRGTRAVVACMQAIRIADVASASSIELPVRTVAGLTNISTFTWLDEDLLAFDAQPDHARGEGLWLMRFDERGHLREVPELRIDAEASLSYRGHSARGDRLLVERVVNHHDVAVLKAGQMTVLAHAYADLILGAARDGSLLMQDTRGTGLYSAADASYRILSAKGTERADVEDGGEAFGIAGDHLLAATTARLARLELSGERRTHLGQLEPPRRDWRWMRFYCSTGGHVCLLAWWSSFQDLDYRIVEDDAVVGGGAVHLPHVCFGLAIRDDRRVALACWNGLVDELDPATNTVVKTTKLPDDADCNLTAQRVAWSGASLYASRLCRTSRTRIFRVQPSGTIETFFDGDRYLGSLAVGGDDTLFIGRAQYTSEPALIEGLR